LLWRPGSGARDWREAVAAVLLVSGGPGYFLPGLCIGMADQRHLLSVALTPMVRRIYLAAICRR